MHKLDIMLDRTFCANFNCLEDCNRKITKALVKNALLINSSITYTLDTCLAGKKIFFNIDRDYAENKISEWKK